MGGHKVSPADPGKPKLKSHRIPDFDVLQEDLEETIDEHWDGRCVGWTYVAACSNIYLDAQGALIMQF